MSAVTDSQTGGRGCTAGMTSSSMTSLRGFTRWMGETKGELAMSREWGELASPVDRWMLGERWQAASTTDLREWRRTELVWRLFSLCCLACTCSTRTQGNWNATGNVFDRMCLCVCVLVCVLVLFVLELLKAVTQKLWYAEYLGHIRVSRSSLQGQGYISKRSYECN